MNKNKNDYFIFNENRNILVHSRYDTPMQCQSSHKYFEIIHKRNNISVEAARFSGSNSTFSALTPYFFPGMDSITSAFKILVRTLTLISCIVTTCM